MGKLNFKEIEKEYRKISVLVNKNNNNSGGGFLNKSIANSWKRSINSWKKYYIENKTNSSNIKYINSITLNTSGNCFKDQNFSKISKNIYNSFSKIISDYKNDKRVSENSVLKIYCDVYDALSDSKLQKMFSTAYSEFDKKKRVCDTSIHNIFVMCNQLMVSFLYYSLTYSTDIISTYSEKNYDLILDEIHLKYASIIKGIGFAALEIAEVLKSIKDPDGELKKAIKAQTEGSEKIAKAKESFDSVTTKNLYYELSNESYLVDDSNEFHEKGTEEAALVVTLIVIASIAGLLALIPLIRRAIYLCGTIKTDMSESLKIDVMTIMVNIESLKEKRDATTDPKERKRIQSIIDKQQKFVDKHKDLVENMNEESIQSSYEAEYEIENEDKEDEKVDSTTSTDGGGDSGDSFQILI